VLLLLLYKNMVIVMKWQTMIAHNTENVWIWCLS